MKIVNIIGGLGNQMFQYAFAYAIKKKYPEEEVLVDIHYFPSYKLFPFELEDTFPGFVFPKATKKQVRKVAYFTNNYKLWRIIRRFLPYKKTEYVEIEQNVFNQSAFERVGDTYYEGYWNIYYYFKDIKDELRDLFVFKQPNKYNQSLQESIKSENAIGIHIRRGDYLKHPKFMGICDLDYYKKAISKLKITGDMTFYVFSNDIPWCKDNIAPLVGNNKIVFVDGNTGKDSYWDMFLMSQCNQLIIANSTFSWWAAMLKKDSGSVIAPKMWKQGVSSETICDPDWILV